MVSVIIQRSHEPQVVKMTEDNLRRESYPPGAEIIVVDNWWEGVQKANNNYICIVEPDCLVSSGYFSSMMGLFQKNPYFRKLAMLSSSVGIDNWANRIFGYKIGDRDSNGVIPLKEMSSSEPYAVEIGYAPGAIIRTHALYKALGVIKPSNDLVRMSTDLSFYFWNTGQRVYVNPSTTYVTTENYVGEVGEFNPKVPSKVMGIFRQEVI